MTDAAGELDLEETVREIVLEMIDQRGALDIPVEGTMKQVAHQVEHGRKVTFHVPGETPLTGYVFGWDKPSVRGPNCWFVLVPNDDERRVEQHFIQRDTARLELHREETFENEKQHSEMSKILRGFRYYIVKTFLAKKSQ